jgi:small subunit ribosomal protein S17
MPRKEKVGVVVSDKMNKTRVVVVEERKSHPRYRKVHMVTTRFKAHDPENASKSGDVVRIIESRKFSKEKCWALKEIIKHTEEV